MALAATVFHAVPGAQAALPPPATLTQTFSGTLIAKLGQTNQGTTRPVTVTVKSVTGFGSVGGFDGDITEVKVVATAGTYTNGDVRINTTTGAWTRTVGSTSRFTLNTPNNAAAEVYINGAWRQIKKVAGKNTVSATFQEEGGKLWLHISGQAPIGVGTQVTAVEIGNLTTGLDAMPLAVSGTPSGLADTSVKPTVKFSEKVNATAGAFTLTCNSTPVAFTVTGSGTNLITLNPTAALPEGVVCVVTVNEALVTDLDTIDGPNAGEGSETFTFTTDSRPIVVSYFPPVDGNQAADVNPQVTFSEPVNLASGAVIMTCGEGQAATTVAVALSQSPDRTVLTINPVPTLPAGITCSVKLLAAKVSDVDTADEPDKLLEDYIFTFETDPAPFVTSIVAEPDDYGLAADNNSSPQLQTHWTIAEEIETDRRLGVFFSEDVTLDTNAITITCGGFVQQFTVALEDGAFVLDPTVGWPAGYYCFGTVWANKVHDTDTADPFDTMQQNATFTFKVDQVPYVVSSNPALGAGYYPGAPITVTFSEGVSLDSDSAELVCYGDTIPLQYPTTSDNLTWEFLLQPTAVLDEIEGQIQGPAYCTFTVFADEVEDTDHVDPPSHMVSDYVNTMLIEQAPVILDIVISPLVEGVAGPNPTFTVTFSETVKITNPASAFTLLCGEAGFEDEPQSLSGGAVTNSLSAVVTASNIGGPSCVFTVNADYVSDTDAIDPPDHPDDDLSETFTTDSAPELLSTEPADGAVVNDNSDTEETWTMTFHWSEDVEFGDDAYAMVCGPLDTVIVIDGLYTGFDSDTSEYLYDLTTEEDLSAYQGQTCTITVDGDEVSDVDSNDPPDNSEDDTITVTIDSAPSVTSVEAIDDSDTVEATLTGVSPLEVISPDWRLKVTFSEAVDIASGAWTLQCGSGNDIAFTLVDATAGEYTNTTTVVIDPDDTDLDESDVDCSLHIAAASVTDTDTADSPDELTADHIVGFSVEKAPDLSEAATISSAGAVTVYFTEAVDIADSPDPVTLVCDSFNIDVTVTGSGTATIVVTPDTTIPEGASCLLTIAKEGITDTDTIDGPDNPAADVSVPFVMDATPEIVSTVPEDNDVIQDNSNSGAPWILTLTWNEAVEFTNDTFSMVCGPSDTVVAISYGFVGVDSDTVELTSTESFAPYAGETCTVSVEGDEVSDVDLVDPPDHSTDYAYTFTIDSAPYVTSTEALNSSSVSQGELATENPLTVIATDWNLRVNFSEAVNIGVGAFAIVCPPSDPVGFVLVDATAGAYTNVTSVDLDLADSDLENLISGNCVLALSYALVFDADEADAPDLMAENYEVSFEVDAAPYVTTSGGSSETGVVEVEFSESVKLNDPETDITFVCGSTPVTFQVSGSGSQTLTITPDATPAVGESCTVIISKTGISDDDSIDPPDNLAADVVVDLTIDAAPEVLLASSTPSEQDALVGGSDTIEIVFSEDVSGTNAFSVTCNSVPVSISVNGSGDTYQISPLSAPWAVDGTLCTLTVAKGLVTDTDTNDAPDNMADDFELNFEVGVPDAAPLVQSSTPLDADAIAGSDTVEIVFSEAVTLNSAAISVTCNSVEVLITVTGSGTTYQVDPQSAPWAIDGAACTLTIDKDLVSDDDANDPADNMAADFVLNFSIGAPPVVTSTNPPEAGFTNGENPISLEFTFDVNIAYVGDDVTVTCTNGSAMVTISVTDNVLTATNASSYGVLAMSGQCSITLAAQDITSVSNGVQMAQDFTLTFTPQVA